MQRVNQHTLHFQIGRRDSRISQLKANAGRWAAAIDPERNKAGNQRAGDLGQKRNQKTKGDKDRHPTHRHKRHMQLRMHRAIGFIVVMFLGWMSGCESQRILAGVLGGMLLVVDVLSRSRPKGEKHKQKQIGSDSIHQMNILIKR
jgi:hypothetical protein